MKLVIDIPDGYKNLLPNIQNGSIACKIILNAVKDGVSYEEQSKGKCIDCSCKTDICQEGLHCPRD